MGEHFQRMEWSSGYVRGRPAMDRRVVASIRDLSSSSVLQALRWVRANESNPEPEGALYGGMDVDGSWIYVGRAHHEGDLIPAKVIPAKSLAYISWNGQEHPKSEFEVLCHGSFAWLSDSDGSVPPGAMEAGSTLSGELLYVGRVRHDTCDVIGKIQPSHGCIYVPYDGQELSFSEYEVLVVA